MSNSLSKDQQLHLTLSVVPPPEMVSEGAKEDRYTRVVPAQEVGSAISSLVQQIVDGTKILAMQGTLIVVVQALPERRQ